MLIVVKNEEMMESFTTDISHIIISIRSPKTETVSIPYNESNAGVLFTCFHDLDHMPKSEHVCLGSIKPYVLFDEEMAKEILCFVKLHENEIDLIVVNCEAGISRSAGVAAALSKILNDEDEYFFKEYLPNMLVYRIMLETAQDTSYFGADKKHSASEASKRVLPPPSIEDIFQ